MIDIWSLIRLPAHCVLCGTLSGRELALCDACQVDIQPGEQDTSCPRCALPLQVTDDNTVCGECLKHPPPYSATYRFALYQPPLDRLVQQLKFHDKLPLARVLGNLMAWDIRAQQIPLPDILMPVPLHPMRLRQRGYNQALEIARYLSREFQLPLDIKSCRRHKATPEQAGLPAKDRRGNIKGAFDVIGDVKQRHIAVIDDVMTTGSTVAELSRALIKAGAARVDVWVCARAVL